MSEVGLKKTELDTPFLWIDLDLMERNISQLSQFHQSVDRRWRPKVRIFKTPAIAHKAIAAGAIGVTCSRLVEAEVMAAAGIYDILLSTQIVSDSKIARLVHLRRQADVKVLVDDAENVQALGAAAQKNGVELGVLVDVNLSGTRTGVPPGQPTLTIAQLAHKTPGLVFLGLAGLEGSFVDVLETTEPAQREQVINKLMGQLTETVAMCRDAGLPVEIISGGGSFTYQYPTILSAYTELLTGGAILSDVAYQSRGVDTRPALFVRTMVSNRPTPDRIVLDAGFKALPPIVTFPRPIGDFPPIKEMRMSAEHGNVLLDVPDTSVKVGDCFDFVVASADATVLLHDALYGIRNDVVEVIWPVPERGNLR